MRKYGLLAEIRRSRPYQKGITRFKTYEDRLEQDFTARKPNDKWVSDITCIHTKQGRLYLAIIKDLFDRSIVAYEIGPRQDNGMLNRLIEKQGRRYTKERCSTAIKVDSMLPKIIFGSVKSPG